MSALSADPIKVGAFPVRHHGSHTISTGYSGCVGDHTRLISVGVQWNLEMQFVRQRHRDYIERKKMKAKLAYMSKMKVDPGKPKSPPRSSKTIFMIVLTMQ